MATFQRIFGAAAIALLAGFLFFANLGKRELASSHEARAGQNAAVILESGRWGLPRLFDEQLELQKPPLYYWLVALIGSLRGGVDAWAVRLPAALAALSIVMLLPVWLWRRGRFAIGVVAAAILTTCCHFTWLARVGRIDMPLTLSVTTALLCFHLGGSWMSRCVGCVAVALGILLKGPIAVALVAAVVLSMAFANWMLTAQGARPAPFLRNGAKRRLDWSWVVCAALVVLLAGPWFVWANAESGGRLWDVFVVYHNFERGFGSETLAAHPPWFYLGRIWLDAFPWSLALPVAGVLAWKRHWWRDDPWCRFGLVWFVAIFALLSLMRFKRADYLLPAYPGLALFLSAAGVRWWQDQRLARPASSEGVEQAARPSKTQGLPTQGFVCAGFLTILLSYAAGWGIYLRAHEETWPYRAAAEKIRAHAGADTPVIFFRAEVHPLAFHLRRPLGSILEWENLEIWAKEPRPVFFVMPAACAAESSARLTSGRLEPVFALDDLLTAKHDRGLVVVRNLP